MFKLEDVAMGIWVNDLKKDGLPVKYETDTRINTDGCNDGTLLLTTKNQEICYACGSS
jgi:beta-1,3-galactosyltransferase